MIKFKLLCAAMVLALLFTLATLACAQQTVRFTSDDQQVTEAQRRPGYVPGWQHCPTCNPQQQPQVAAQQQVMPGYAMIRQRRGLFGWRCRWVAVPTMVRPVQPVPAIWVW